MIACNKQTSVKEREGRRERERERERERGTKSKEERGEGKDFTPLKTHTESERVPLNAHASL